jgi:hypothetical protein
MKWKDIAKLMVSTEKAEAKAKKENREADRANKNVSDKQKKLSRSAKRSGIKLPTIHTMKGGRSVSSWHNKYIKNDSEGKKKGYGSPQDTDDPFR